jgi:drug/metabolite transporter (DMT)-like permease
LKEKPSSQPLGADALLVLITAVWGITFVTVKDALDSADTFTFLALRFGTGAVAAFLVARGQVLRRSFVRSGAILSALLFIGFALQTQGLALTTPSRSAFITGLSVVLVPVVSFALFRRRPRLPSLVGIGFAVAGLYLLTGVASADGSQALRGDFLTLGCAVAYAFHISLTERFAPQQGAVALVAIQLAGVSLLSGLAIPLVPHHVTWTPGFVGAFVFCGVVASAGAITVQTWAQARTSAVRAALIFSLEPVFAAAYSVLVGRERLGLREIAGGALIVLGILVAEAGAVLLGRFRRADAPS